MDNSEAQALYLPAAREALKAFPVAAARIRILSVSENVSFRVDEADGRALVLRLHRPGYNSLGELKSERAWTQALRAAGVPAPQGVPARSGEAYVRIAIPAAGERRWVGLLAWTEGELLGEALARDPAADSRLRWFRRLGALMAAMHAQVRAWRAPQGFVRPHRNAAGLLGKGSTWGRFWEHEGLSGAERGLLLAARDKIQPSLRRLGKDPHRYGLIHADLHPWNLLISGDRLFPIDFDDSGFGWNLYDIAVALFASRTSDDFPEITAAFLEGYRSKAALSDGDAELVPMFLLIRALAVIGWLRHRPEHAVSEARRRYFTELKAWTCAAAEAFEAVI
ncbi:MAG TPA: phosphotransferase [Caulobacteraceae bacterium]|nr:phosphotransferase [Caulobacteraceae bacterium]